MCSVDDKLLLQALLQGLDAHFKDLMEAYSPELSVFVAAKVKYPDDQDVLQNIFLRIFKGLRSMSEQNLQTLQLQSWIYEVTRNAIRDYYRKQRQILSATSISILDTEEQDIEDTSCNQPEELIE